MASENKIDKKIKVPDIVSISTEANSSNIILFDKVNNFVIKCNFDDYSGSLPIVLKSSHSKIKSGELLKKTFVPFNAKYFAIVVSEAETRNFNLKTYFICAYFKSRNRKHFTLSFSQEACRNKKFLF